MMKENKLASALQVRLPLHLRNKFTEVANKNHKVPSKLIRDFIHTYIKENDNDK